MICAKFSRNPPLQSTLLALLLVWAGCVGSTVLPSVGAAEPAGAAAPNTLTEAERAAGWQLLFNGRDTAGWRSFRKPGFPTQGWVVHDGWLMHREKGGGGDIVTTDTVGDFEFSFEWRLAKGANGGVKYFILEERGEAIGHEYQLWDPSGEEPSKVAAKHLTASFYDVLPPQAGSQPKPPGEINHSRILVRGQQVEHWLNGQQVLAYELGSEAVRQAVAASKFKNVSGFGTKVRGRLLLQDHGGEVWFRNLKLKAERGS
jgi:hypothetical protein